VWDTVVERVSRAPSTLVMFHCWVIPISSSRSKRSRPSTPTRINYRRRGDDSWSVAVGRYRFRFCLRGSSVESRSDCAGCDQDAGHEVSDAGGDGAIAPAPSAYEEASSQRRARREALSENSVGGLG
jgi:hypothetical protein